MSLLFEKSNCFVQGVWAIANLAVNDDLKESLGDLDAVRILFALLETIAGVDEEQCIVQIIRAIANLAVTLLSWLPAIRIP